MDLKTILLTMIKRESQPISGYELTKRLAEKSRHAHQQVYRELEKLNKAGLVFFKRLPQEGKPDRKEFSATHRATDNDFFLRRTNFARTQASYCLLAADMQNHTELFERYIEHMEKAEIEILTKLGIDYEDPDMSKLMFSNDARKKKKARETEATK